MAINWNGSGGGLLGGQASGGSGLLGGILGGGNGSQRLQDFWNSDAVLPTAAALIAGPTFRQGLASAFATAGAGVEQGRKRRALNDVLKSTKIGADLSPETQTYLRENPDFAQNLIAYNLTPKPPVVVPWGSSLYDPVSHQYSQTPGGGGAYSPTNTEGADSNAILRGQTDEAFRASPEYALAWSRISKPQLVAGLDDAGNTISTPIPPDLTGLKPPINAAGGAPAAPAATGGPVAGKPIITGKAKPSDQAVRAAEVYTQVSRDYQTARGTLNAQTGLREGGKFNALTGSFDQAVDPLGKVGRFFQSKDYQVAHDAVKNIVTKYQYVISGANSPEDETIRNMSLIMPDYTDGPAAVAEKSARLDGLMQAMEVAAKGGSIPPDLIQKIGIVPGGTGGGGGAAAGGVAKEGATATGPGGHQIVVKGGRWIDAQTGQPLQ